MLTADYHYEDLHWLDTAVAEIAAAVERDTFPHALLIHGPYGTGRRQLAKQVAELVLGNKLDDNDQHANLYEVCPIDDKQIKVDQIRALIEFMQLTSHGHGSKIAAIYPADRMTDNAANSLLKTLEEPPGKSMLIIVAENLASLPPTVISRCQQLRVAAPAHADGVTWLTQHDSAENWGGILEFCGNAPLYALELQQQGFIDKARGYAADLNALQQGRADPVAIAKQWAKDDVSLCLRWLYSQAAKVMRQQSGARNATQSTEACYVYLRELLQLRRSVKSGLNMELNLAHVLYAWYGGFTGLPQD